VQRKGRVDLFVDERKERFRWWAFSEASRPPMRARTRATSSPPGRVHEVRIEPEELFRCLGP